ncbi:uncharacterized protein BJ212DRAFT_1296443 [Suillus subaureus]|uniref:Uncharacterized protein n=1 Tax=Suillus subaureus TaxID=48587 RepID=A0A9P7EK47_9AGAM|nr:uncharacterized protein BJ212DRAFT_1296443 [Suillus subaureus]KAG1823925.1 hypothetical protein BJ212DRAFT_1296443 [Suillus subaureus]
MNANDNSFSAAWKIDTSEVERQQWEALIQHKLDSATAAKKKATGKQASDSAKETCFAGVVLVLDQNQLVCLLGPALKDQIEVYCCLGAEKHIPLKSHLKSKSQHLELLKKLLGHHSACLQVLHIGYFSIIYTSFHHNIMHNNCFAVEYALGFKKMDHLGVFGLYKRHTLLNSSDQPQRTGGIQDELDSMQSKTYSEKRACFAEMLGKHKLTGKPSSKDHQLV